MRAIPLPNPPLTDGEIRLRPWERRDVAAVAARCLQRRAERITDVGVREGFLATSACRALAAVAAGQATAAR